MIALEKGSKKFRSFHLKKETLNVIPCDQNHQKHDKPKADHGDQSFFVWIEWFPSKSLNDIQEDLPAIESWDRQQVDDTQID